MEVQRRGKQSSDHGAHQGKGEDEVLIARREDVLPGDRVGSLEFLDLVDIRVLSLVTIWRDTHKRNQCGNRRNDFVVKPEQE